MRVKFETDRRVATNLKEYTARLSDKAFVA